MADIHFDTTWYNAHMHIMLQYARLFFSSFFIEPQKLRTQRTFQRIHFTRFTPLHLALCSQRSCRFFSENFVLLVYCCCWRCHWCCCLWCCCGCCCSYLWSFPLQFIVVNNNKYICTPSIYIHIHIMISRGFLSQLLLWLGFLFIASLVLRHTYVLFVWCSVCFMLWFPLNFICA